MGTMDKVDSALGWMLQKGYGSLVFCICVLAMLFLFQRQVDNEQSRILADVSQNLKAVGGSVVDVAKQVDQLAKRTDAAESRADRIDDFGTKYDHRHEVPPK